MEDRAHYMHHLPGRLRVRNPMFRNNPSLMGEIEHCFKAAQGVSKIAANPLTGSVTLTYDPDVLAPEKVLEIFEACEYIDAKNAATLDSKLKASFDKTGRYMGRAALSLLVDYALKGSNLSFLSVLI